MFSLSSHRVYHLVKINNGSPETAQTTQNCHKRGSKSLIKEPEAAARSSPVLETGPQGLKTAVSDKSEWDFILRS